MKLATVLIIILLAGCAQPTDTTNKSQNDQENPETSYEAWPLTIEGAPGEWVVGFAQLNGTKSTSLKEKILFTRSDETANGFMLPAILSHGTSESNQVRFPYHDPAIDGFIHPEQTNPLQLDIDRQEGGDHKFVLFMVAGESHWNLNYTISIPGANLSPDQFTLVRGFGATFQSILGPSPQGLVSVEAKGGITYAELENPSIGASPMTLTTTFSNNDERESQGLQTGQPNYIIHGTFKDSNGLSQSQVNQQILGVNQRLGIVNLPVSSEDWPSGFKQSTFSSPNLVG